MKKKILKWIGIVPILQLLLSAMSNYIRFDFFNAADTIGYSLACGLVYFVLFWLTPYRYCPLTRYSVIGLIFLNFISWIGKSINYETYYKLYDTAVVFLVLIFALIYKLRNVLYKRIIRIYHKGV